MSPSKPRRRKRDYLPAPPDIWVTSRGGGNEDVDGAGDANNADAADSAAENTRTHDLPTQNHNADHDPFHLSPFPPAPYAMNAFPAVAATAAQRPTPTLRNTQKSAVGNGLGGGIGGGWGGSAAVGGAGGAAAAASGNGSGNAGGFGLGGALGTGLGGGLGSRPAQLSGFAQVMGGGQAPIDMSDFPSLGGGPRPAPSSAAAAGWHANTIRQISQSQVQPPQSQPQQQQQRAPSTAPSQQSIDPFDGQRASQPSVERTEDAFPPLGGQLNGDALQSNGLGSSIASPDGAQAQQNGQQAQLPIRNPSNTYQQQPQQAPIGSGQPASQPQQQLQAAIQNGQAPPANIKRYTDMTEDERYGLTGLLAAFEARRALEAGQPVDDTLPPAMRNGVMLGQDLSTLGMDLDSPDPIYPTFTPFPLLPERSSGSNFDFFERNVVPDFTLPSAYTVTNVPPLERRMGAFSDETLFSIFYQNPNDYRQELAAIELTARDWRWHKILRQWLQKDTREVSTGSLPIIDLAPTLPVAAPTVRLGERTERGVYVFFDAMNWQRQRREFVLDYGELDHKHAGVGGQVVPGMGANGMSGGGGGGAVGPAPGLGGGGPVQPPGGLGGLSGGGVVGSVVGAQQRGVVGA
ncbi:transcriptional regulator [Friedmanniomyces endolithicus]|uniref:Transcriptional regulator n=1 Tax=Friedmanniomyces endolithicus TaxID=329885 RepID=A0AAN6KVA1_9PEZI|nr:transcriptional regulator [Friedmanniomyces endolithicus]KAK0821294.1 transcriptional regulator [Friedmanniomyces endolithicus]KAK0873084.1 transcriptional regulator [Friedmanniomyces endolithicus]KAK0916799.1 transcriptional regulator [Friedmanniomyces endolithicus]KAK1005115.1 transcriptional regulator [Friedmanniomyces endolithicus]